MNHNLENIIVFLIFIISNVLAIIAFVAILLNFDKKSLSKRKKPILYCDIDGVLADYDSAKQGTTEEDRRQKGFFENLAPINGGLDAFKELTKYYDVYFLSTAPWSNIHAPSEKRVWVEKHLGEYAFKKLILTHNKGLLKGDYLIDDRIANGVDNFEGEHIHFGTEQYPDWNSIIKYLTQKQN